MRVAGTLEECCSLTMVGRRVSAAANTGSQHNLESAAVNVAALVYEPGCGKGVDNECCKYVASTCWRVLQPRVLLPTCVSAATNTGSQLFWRVLQLNIAASMYGPGCEEESINESCCQMCS